MSEGIRNLKLYPALPRAVRPHGLHGGAAGRHLLRGPSRSSGLSPSRRRRSILAAVVAALAYLSIIYALSVTLQHIGKGICVLLVFAQIPGATGLYPVEMTSSFFQTVYPFMPFTYGINAHARGHLRLLRQPVRSRCCCVLVAVLRRLSMALGLLIRPAAAPT